MAVKPALVVLAAGMGSRYGGLKQMDGFGPNGENIIDYSVYDAIRAGFGKVVFIVREHFINDFKEFFSGKFDDLIEVEYVTQELDKLPEGYTVPEGREKPWGTAHAVMMAAEVVHEPFVVINADDFYGRDSYERVAQYFAQLEESGDDEFAVVGYRLRNTLSDHGTVNRGVCYADADGFLEKVVECVKIARKDDGTITYPTDQGPAYLEEETLVSMNMWGFLPSFFERTADSFRRFLDAHGHVLKSEFYIPSAIDEMINNRTMQVRVISSDSEWFGVTYKEDKPFVMARITELIKQGVYPADLWAKVPTD